MKFKLMYFILLLLLVNLTIAQDDSDPRRNNGARMHILGPFPNLPAANNHVNPNTTTKLYHTPMGDVSVPPNIIPFPTTTYEYDVAAVNMSGNTNTMYAAWVSFGSAFYGTGFCLTTNGGANWSGNYNNMNPANNASGQGLWIWPNGCPWAGRLGISVTNSNYTATVAFYSSDNGVTWTVPVAMGGSSPDKSFSCVDDVAGSPFFGRAYTLWTDFSGTNNNRVVGAYTSDGGVTWTGYQPVSPAPASGHHCQGCDVSVGPNGVVYAVWAHCLTNGQTSTEINLGFAKSTNGGVSWTSQTNTAVNTNGIRTTNLFNDILANGFPRIAIDKSGGAHNGWIYVTMSEKLTAPARDNADVCLCRSTDGGTTWTHTLVNTDTAGNYNWEAAVCVNNNGTVAVSYFDTRNTTIPQTQFYMSFSNNGGSSFSDIQVSDHNFAPYQYGQFVYMSDFTGITYGNGKFWPFWTDGSSGHLQAWTAGVSTVVLAHDYSCGPFLSYPPYFIINTAYPIKTKVLNLGSSAETSVPVKFFIDGVLTNTTNLSLAAGGVDSVSNNWMTPGSAGVHNLMYVTALGTDLDRTNDTVRMTANVLTAPPPTICPFFCQPTTTYTAISGSPGPVGDDVGLTAPIGFTFNYVGTNYTQVWICTNGFIVLGASGTTTYTNALCTTGDPTALNLIAPFWDDLNTTNGGNIQYTTTGPAPYRVFTCQWTNVAYFSGSGNVTMQIKLYENGGTGGVVDFVYGPATNNAGSSGSVGMNVQPGGSGNVQSITPGSTCGNTTSSTTTCNDAVVYNFANGTLYRFCGLDAVNPISNTVPNVFTLEQNYPNPFNPTTNIKFGIPKAGLVKLVVYDILGRVVETLVYEFKEAGTYKVNFDGTNFASGVYLYRLESGDFTEVKKMLLVK